MDEFDHAQELELAERARLISLASSGPTLPMTGQCHHCDAPVEQGRRFCDADCRDDYEALLKARKRNGFYAPVSEQN